ncbi:hypothetical protein KW791_03070 [Candidatus Parcubacteria bacterium]|nr:hypothetical protein [Candidatus Parcubacteria bacterium]
MEQKPICVPLNQREKNIIDVLYEATKLATDAISAIQRQCDHDLRLVEEYDYVLSKINGVYGVNAVPRQKSQNFWVQIRCLKCSHDNLRSVKERCPKCLQDMVCASKSLCDPNEFFEVKHPECHVAVRLDCSNKECDFKVAILEITD